MRTFSTAVAAVLAASSLVFAAPVTTSSDAAQTASVVAGSTPSATGSAAASSSTASGSTGSSTGSASSPMVSTARGTWMGSSKYGVESFRGIPFAMPPTGDLRFAPPQEDTRDHGTFDATNWGPSCLQMTGVGNPVVSAIVGTFEAAALGKDPTAASTTAPNNQSEDCLSVNVFRPQGTPNNASLPVLAWIYGGGFLFGESSTYDPTVIMLRAMATEKPVVYVSMNYRLNSFGFMPGQEMADDNSTSINAGLLDQRLALEWIHQNIASFGGDPEKVTVFGESAGAISVAYQTTAYWGNISSKYDGKPLFRAAIMESGAPTPAGPAKVGQHSFDVIANATNCSSASNKISCLRGLSADQLLNATNLLPNLDYYTSLAIPFLPRTDYDFIPETADKLVKGNHIANGIAILSGNQYDEGTTLTMGTGLNVTTEEGLDNWLATVFSPMSTSAQRQKLLELYPQDFSKGSPFDTGELYALAPQYKRIAAMLGDMVFQAPRRGYIGQTKQFNPTWSYASRAFRNTPVIGTFHASDVYSLYGARPGAPGPEMQDRWIAFAYNMNPNTAPWIEWPEYKDNMTLLEFTDSNSTLISDTYRKEQTDYILSIESSLIV
ncbi:hypothetical protein JCM10212_004136 [Sporobolomyces blumeae]